MQEVSQTYKDLVIQPNHRFEVSLVIGESGRLVTERSEVVLFANTAILVASSNAESGYREEMLYSVKTSESIFRGSVPEVGCCISGEIDVKMVKPTVEIPRRALLKLYVRVTDGTTYSEWIPQGVYYADTREVVKGSNGLDAITIHGYDAMVMFEETYPSDNTHNYPLIDTAVVTFLADSIGVRVDERTWDIMTDGYTIPLPVGYSSREVLGMIGSAYGGSWIMSRSGELRLVQFFGIPKESRLLVDEGGYAITFGVEEEVRILV